MKKILLFALMALIGTMSMNAQIMKIRKGNTVVAVLTAEQADRVVFEDVPQVGIGTAKATIGGTEVDVKWIQLWEGGPKFAEYNVGVTDGKPESYGCYYAWGGSQDKADDYVSGSSALTGNSDTATKLWGSNWRMPTKAELEALLSNCDVVWTDNYKESEIKGRIFTGKGDFKYNSVFLPAAGNSESRYVSGKNTDGYYWTSEPSARNRTYYLNFRSSTQGIADSSRYYDYSVRAVLSE